MTDAENQRVYDLSDRLLNFAAKVIWFIPNIESSNAGRYLANQLMRSGANTKKLVAPKARPTSFTRCRLF
jgi:hypothetical protein